MSLSGLTVALKHLISAEQGLIQINRYFVYTFSSLFILFVSGKVEISLPFSIVWKSVTETERDDSCSLPSKLTNCQ